MHTKSKIDCQKGIEVSLKELISLQNSVRFKKYHKQNKSFKFSGQKLSKIRGRGMEFDSTREYYSGDDIRRMAWRVTARSSKPHIKVFTEDKEQPLWLALDLSPSLYFGTKNMFKSVAIIKQAALMGWSHLLKGDKVGSVIATKNELASHIPKASQQNFLRILNDLSQCSKIKYKFTENQLLDSLLFKLRHHVRSGDKVIIFSDFYNFSEKNQKIILYLSQKATVNIVSIYDPLEAEVPVPYCYTLTDGVKNISFNMTNKHNRLNYQKQFSLHQDLIKEFCFKNNILLNIFSTNSIDFK